MSTPDFAAQAAKYVADAQTTELDFDDWVDPDGKPWKAFRVDMPDLNTSIDLGAYDETDARAKAQEFVAERLAAGGT